MIPPNDPLDSVLDQWGQPPEQPALAPDVWRRLATQPPRTQRHRSRLGWWQALDLTFGRASFATAFIAACLLLGLFLAELRVSHLRSTRDQELAAAYLRLIDPLLVDPTPPSPAPGS